MSSARFLPEKNYKAYKEAKKAIEQDRLTVNVSYSTIEYIILPFDSFDWKNSPLKFCYCNSYLTLYFTIAG
ncbi:hypothetical protein MYP_1481 [Sporocytophaga myxococcoides]|uniref:Uncharacterized protein n=1 Tax=Sporocytophaga myxococcoides TaxID=153721 RepID=A0A098LDW4_9BACT|nr:hypothetical protein [Sporocytophaga myxococcoides]GAL84253.1 hypothetical protein MYP_1481 [Sporocytophaga myxococcoides]